MVNAVSCGKGALRLEEEEVGENRKEGGRKRGMKGMRGMRGKGEGKLEETENGKR